ncbi:MAG: hypothetical protein KC708_01480 [Anaerolineae bacterium]|nr:hypothetical protein [Anaerolineae bacterium]
MSRSVISWVANNGSRKVSKKTCQCVDQSTSQTQ